MGYFESGMKTIPQIIDIIADKLILASTYWEDGDVACDTTTDTTYDNARRCLKYTGDADDIWLLIDCVNYCRRMHKVYYAKGIRLTFCSNWDSENHTWGTTATMSQMFIPFHGNSSSTVYADMAVWLHEFFLYVDATGFGLYITPRNHPNDALQATAFICVEHMNVKEYIDGQSNFYAMADLNTNWWNASYQETYYHCHRFIRPFLYETWIDNDGLEFWYDSYYAYENTADGKIYHMRPVVYNDQAERKPIGECDMFVMISEGYGARDGDILSREGETTQYLMLSRRSPSSAGRLPIAMKMTE
jgi:hypothetical protein